MRYQINVECVLKAVYDVIAHHTDHYARLTEPVMSAVGMRRTAQTCLEMSIEKWENICWDCGKWEWIDGSIGMPTNESQPPLRNGYQELVGIARLRESLEANEWESTAVCQSDVQDYVGANRMVKTNDPDCGLDMEAIAMQADVDRPSEFAPHWEMEEQAASDVDDSAEAGSEEEIRATEQLMAKLQAMRDISIDVPEAERRSFAARAVTNLMKEI